MVFVTRWVYPGTAASVDRDSKTAWTNPDYAKTPNGQFVSCGPGSYTYGDWLQLTNFGFAAVLPPADLIDAIVGAEIFIRRYANNGNIKDSALYLLKAGAQAGDNKASAAAWPSTAAANVADAWYGGAADLWGTTLNYADVTDTNFGIALSILNAWITSTGYVDVIGLRLYFTTVAGGRAEIGQVSGWALEGLNGGIAGASLLLLEGIGGIGGVSLYVLEGTPLVAGGRRTFPLPQAQTVWQSQSGKRTFPLPGEQDLS